MAGPDDGAPEQRFTYTLHAEPGAIGLNGSEVDIVGFWLEHVLRRAAERSPDRDAVEELRRRVLDGLTVLRSGQASPAGVRYAAEDAIVAALALGFHHAGDLDVVRQIEAEMKARQIDRRVADMNKGRRRPEDTVAVVKAKRDEYLLEHPAHEGKGSQIGRGIIRKIRSAIGRGEEFSAEIVSIFRPCEADDPKLLNRVRRMLTDLDER